VGARANTAWQMNTRFTQFILTLKKVIVDSIIMIFHHSMKKSRKESIEQTKEKPNLLKELKLNLTLFNTVIISLIVVGSLLLIQVGVVMWKDVTVWGKDFSLIFFGSRTSENISLGIGLQIIHYYLIGILFLFSAIILFFSKKL
jgi:hypothetical protein